uniref:Reverse transcriptase domain-containing protein n=1 Tax=Neogobius melanostomus TaxID=47308 RepID=A0A8C6SBV1_9GOBI
MNTNAGKVSVLVLLDLSAAFDTVDHGILLHRLENWVGISGTALNWFKSYLEDRTYFVKNGNCVHKITCGVPQGSILGPVLFNLYMLPLGDVIRRHGVNFHSYADDTQLYISMSPDDTRPMDALFNCILDIESWMTENFLQLNQDKTEVLVIGPEAQREKLLPKLQSLCGVSTAPPPGVLCWCPVAAAEMLLPMQTAPWMVFPYLVYLYPALPQPYVHCVHCFTLSVWCVSGKVGGESVSATMCLYLWEEVGVRECF